MNSLHLGIDFHKNTCTLCFLGNEGTKEISTVRTMNVIKYIANKNIHQIAVEASGGVNDFVDKLKAAGHKVVLVNPSAFRLIGFNGKKTDKKDAIALAEGLKGGYLPEVFHKNKSSRELKSLLVGREQVIRSRVNLANSMRGILREQGLTMPASKESFIQEIRGSISQVKHPQIEMMLQIQYETFVKLMADEERIETLLEELTQNISEIKLLRTIPGVGPMTAMAAIAVIDDIKRFDNGKNFASYLGLVPRESSSGNKKQMGSITRSGSEILRRYLIHGARSVLMHSARQTKTPITDVNKLWALRLKEKKGMNKATVALAHRMARILFAVLRDGEIYEGRALASAA